MAPLAAAPATGDAYVPVDRGTARAGCHGTGLNHEHAVVGYCQSSSGSFQFRAVVSSAAGTPLRDLGPIDASGTSSTVALAVNDRGDVVGNTITSMLFPPFPVWFDPATQTWGAVPGPGAGSIAAVNNSRVAVGYVGDTTQGQQTAGVWDLAHGTFVPPSPLTGVRSTLRDINDAGQAVGCTLDPSPTAFRYDLATGSLQTLDGPPSSTGSCGEAISRSGLVAVTVHRADGTTRGLVWDPDAGTTAEVELLDGRQSMTVGGVTDRRQVVGTQRAGDGPTVAFTWDPRLGSSVLPLPAGATASEATDIVEDGTIAGSAALGALSAEWHLMEWQPSGPPSTSPPLSPTTTTPAAVVPAFTG